MSVLAPLQAESTERSGRATAGNPWSLDVINDLDPVYDNFVYVCLRYTGLPGQCIDEVLLRAIVGNAYLNRPQVKIQRLNAAAAPQNRSLYLLQFGI